MKFFKYLFIVIYLLWSQQLAASECENFEDKVLSIPYPENGMVTAGEQAKNDLGIFFHQEFDYDKDVIKIRRDKNNYPILKFSFFEKNLQPGTSIIKVDEQDLSQLSKYEIKTSRKKRLKFLHYKKHIMLKQKNMTYTLLN